MSSAVADYRDRFRPLVQLEREEEMERHEREIRSLSGPERQRRGRALLELRGRDEGEALEGHRVKFMRRPGQELPETEITAGDLVMVSRDDPTRDDNPTGTVVQKTGYSVTAAFDGRLPGFVFGQGLRLDLYVNDIPYQRMLTALGRLDDLDGARARLRDVLVGAADPGPAEPAAVERWFEERLDDAQRRAVRRSLGAEELFLVHGPPGTGKTTTLAEAARQHVARGDTVLCTADSNVAVDNVVERLAVGGADVVRVGHPARVTPALREHTLDSRLREDESWIAAQELREQAFDLKDRQEDLTHPSGRHRRGMSNGKIRELAEAGRGSRGVSASRVREMAEWIELQEEADGLFERADRLREKAIDRVLQEADVVCSTNSTAGSDLLVDRRFDVVLVDEGTQATEPSCLVPLTLADRAVLAGDHRQLPPTVLSPEAADRGLDRSLFERMAERYANVVEMLTVQYRMHERIMTFPSERFYEGRLRASEEVGAHTLRDLGFDDARVEGRYRRITLPEDPVVFVDTSEAEGAERQRGDSSSRENPAEAELVVRLAQSFRWGGVPDRAIGVISPYADQVDRVRRDLDDAEELEVHTVDGFQGREKEVVLLSLVRDNERGEVGFLRDVRRLNVALTRARRKLVVVGNAATVGSEDVYRDFLAYVDRAGARIVA